MWGQGFGTAAELPLGPERHVNAGSAGELLAKTKPLPMFR